MRRFPKPSGGTRLRRLSTPVDRFWCSNHDDASLPSSVLGYAYLGVYRGKAGWAHTAEDSIYLLPDVGGRGLGTRLLQALVDATDAAVTRNIVAVISEKSRDP